MVWGYVKMCTGFSVIRLFASEIEKLGFEVSNMEGVSMRVVGAN